MLAFVPVIFEAYRQIPARAWPVMQVLVAHADRGGRCWPGVRRIAELTTVPKSTVARYLTALAGAGHLSRTRKPGGVYVYQIAARFLPAAVSQRPREPVPIEPEPVPLPAPETVPPCRTEERITEKKSPAVRAVPVGESEWRKRLTLWQRFDGRFWRSQWGPMPSQPGCAAPTDLVARYGG